MNESYNELLIEDEDYKTLRDSTDSQDAFDSLGLAKRLEKHDLLEFRRLAAHLYKKNSKWERALFALSLWRGHRAHILFSPVSIALSKEDKLFKDAIETAATSASTEIAEELLTYFVYATPFPFSSLHIRSLTLTSQRHRLEGVLHLDPLRVLRPHPARSGSVPLLAEWSQRLHDVRPFPFFAPRVCVANSTCSRRPCTPRLPVFAVRGCH